MSADPPYLRIAASLRARITSGALPPGAALPSVRALARRHRVSPTTAAHALRVLVDEGIARAEPRVGAVVTTPGARDPALSRASVVAAAVALADEGGVDAVSMRAVAARLGAPPMSIYRHVEGKEALLRAMAEAVFARYAPADDEPAGWRARVELAARAQWAMLRTHPWLARVMSVSRPMASVTTVRFADRVLAALDLPGLDHGSRLRLHIVLHAFAQGLALNVEEEQRALGETGTTEEAWMRVEEPRFEALARAGGHRAFAEVLAGVEAFDLDFDRLFETGLAVFLDGVAAMAARRRAE